MILATIRTVLPVAFVALAGALWLSQGIDRQKAERVSAGFVEPVTTGSIASAGSVKLDPCAIPPRR